MGTSFRGYSVIGAILINIKQNLVIHMWGYKFVRSLWVTHESHKRWFHSIPNEVFFLQQTKYLTLQIYFVVILKLWFFFLQLFIMIYGLICSHLLVYLLCVTFFKWIVCEMNLLFREITIPQHLLVHLRFVVFVVHAKRHAYF